MSTAFQTPEVYEQAVRMGYQSGQVAGGYEFLDVLESSKNGVTYKVRNVVSQRLEMLKVLPRNMQDDRDKEERFLREIKVHSRIEHPNIVSFFDAGQIDGQLVMTTELVEGTTLAQRLELGALKPEEAVSFVDQMLAALNCAHEHGVVHREITPANILVTPEGTIKLTGLGMAKGATDPQLTQAGTALGSLPYMAPEQVKGATEVDARTDIYSVGIVLYEMLTGSVPFAAKSQFEVMVAHVSATPEPPSKRNPRLPAALDEVVLKALAKEPAQRYQSAEEFRSAMLSARPGAPHHPEPNVENLWPVPAQTQAPRVPVLDISVDPAIASVDELGAALTAAGFVPTAVPPKRNWGMPLLMVAGLAVFVLAAVACYALLSSIGKM